MLGTIKNIGFVNQVLRKKIVQVLNGDIIGFISDNSIEYELAIAISYFTSSKEYIINKKGSKKNKNLSLDTSIDDSEFSEIFNGDDGPKIYYPDNISYVEILDRLRNAFLHSGFFVDYENKIIKIDHLDENYQKNLVCTIPFSWLINFAYNGLTEKKNSNQLEISVSKFSESSYLQTTTSKEFVEQTYIFDLKLNSEDAFNDEEIITFIKDYLRHSPFKYNNKHDEGIYRYMITNKLINKDNHEYLSFFYDLESLKKELNNKFNISLEYKIRNLELENIEMYINKDINEKMTIHEFEYYVQQYLNEGDNFYKNIRMIKNCIYYSNCLLNSETYLYYKEMFDSYLKGNTFEDDLFFQNEILDIIINKKYKNEEVSNVMFTANTLKDIFSLHQKDILITLLFIYGQNILAINKDFFDRLDNSIIETFGISVYTSKKIEMTDYKVDQFDLLTSQKELLVAKRALNKKIQQRNNVSSDDIIAVNNIEEKIEVISEEIRKLEQTIEELEKKSEIFLKENASEIITIAGKKMMRDDSKSEMLRIIRNCFSHSGRIMFSKSNDKIIMMDFNNNGNVSGYIECEIETIINFLSQNVFKNPLNYEENNCVQLENNVDISSRKK